MRRKSKVQLVSLVPPDQLPTPPAPEGKPEGEHLPEGTQHNVRKHPLRNILVKAIGVPPHIVSENPKTGSMTWIFRPPYRTAEKVLAYLRENRETLFPQWKNVSVSLCRLDSSGAIGIRVSLNSLKPKQGEAPKAEAPRKLTTEELIAAFNALPPKDQAEILAGQTGGAK